MEPLLPHFSPGRARVRLGSFGAAFPPADAELEGFARPLWGLAPLAAGGGEFAHWDRWRAGLVAGCDPDDPEHWRFYESTAQTMVEQAAIGFALAVTPETLWEPLAPDERRALTRWLSLVNRHEPVRNNWQFFRVLVNLGLERVGAPVDEAAVQRSLDLIDSYYLDDGWYRDGITGNRDHYIGWAMHAYGLLYAHFRPDDARGGAFRERARRFARDFETWFDPQGGVVPFGRSLTYRFAAAGFWAALAFAGEEALPWGRIKGLLLRHLRWWSTRPISDRDGVLSLGFSYTNPWMREEYNSACSPYWAMKAFLPVALPESHPFWQADEEPVSPCGIQPQPHAGMLLSRDSRQSLALSGGHSGASWMNQGPAKYGRFAYSSVFGFSADGLQRGAGASHDSCLLLLRPDQPATFERHVWEHAVEGDLVYSRWTSLGGVQVHTVLSGRAPWHVRVHRVVVRVAVEAEESGFALGAPDPDAFEVESTAGLARATSSLGASAVHDLGGGRTGEVRELPPNANLMHPHARVPLLRASLEPGTHDLCCAVYASDAADPSEAGEIPTIPEAALRLLERVTS